MTAPLDPDLVGALVAEGAIDDAAPGRPFPAVPLAEHRNHTPFPAQYFQTVDQHAEVFHVIALRVTYDMRSCDTAGRLCHAEVQTPLATEDVWAGAVNESSPLWESDFAPFKPKCDVLVVNAWSRPERGRRKRWPCGVAVLWEDDEHTYQWVKHLMVQGPGEFGRLGPSGPEPVDEVAICWENAFGGQVRQPAHDQVNSRGEVTKLAGSERWTTDERNPVGSGFDSRPGRPTPQLIPGADGGAAPTAQQLAAPVGLNPVGRAWLPRRQLAGTHDNEWLARQWPLPPMDMDWAYWNCAPADQQISYPQAGLRVHLMNLHPPRPAAPLSALDQGVWRGQLPHEEFFVLWRLQAGPILARPSHLDTLVVDLGAQRIYATYRALLSAKADVRVAESRVKRPSDKPQDDEAEERHGG